MGHVGNPKGFRLSNNAGKPAIVRALARSDTQYDELIKSGEFEVGRGVTTLHCIRFIRRLRKRSPKRRKNRLFAFRWGYAFKQRISYTNAFFQNIPAWQNLWHIPYDNYGLSVSLSETENFLKFLTPKVMTTLGRRKESGYATHALTSLTPSGEVNSTVYVVDKWQVHYDTTFVANDVLASSKAIALGNTAYADAKTSLKILFGELAKGIKLKNRRAFYAQKEKERQEKYLAQARKRKKQERYNRYRNKQRQRSWHQDKLGYSGKAKSSKHEEKFSEKRYAAGRAPFPTTTEGQEILPKKYASQRQPTVEKQRQPTVEKQRQPTVEKQSPQQNNRRTEKGKRSNV